MTSPDLKAAAGRLLLSEYDQNGLLDGPDGQVWSQVMDGHCVSRAYLAEHPADDGEPVTAEWLESVGFENVDGRLSEIGLLGWRCMIAKEGVVELSISASQAFINVRFGGMELPYPSTRGAVRALTAALGIELNEPTEAD